MRLIEVPNQPTRSLEAHSATTPSIMEEGADANSTFLTRNDLNTKGHALLDEIMAYRNQSVIERFLADNPEATVADAEKAWKGLLQFFTVSVMNRGAHTPSKMIDEMWHAFVLHMKDYENFCKKYLRKMVYHSPAHDDGAFKFYAVARNAVIALFGEADPMVWPREHARYLRCISCPEITGDFMFGDCLKIT